MDTCLAVLSGDHGRSMKVQWHLCSNFNLLVRISNEIYCSSCYQCNCDCADLKSKIKHLFLPYHGTFVICSAATLYFDRCLSAVALWITTSTRWPPNCSKQTKLVHCFTCMHAIINDVRLFWLETKFHHTSTWFPCFSVIWIFRGWHCAQHPHRLATSQIHCKAQVSLLDKWSGPFPCWFQLRYSRI